MKLGGAPGAAMGVFFASGLLHDWGMWGMGMGTDFSRVAGYFLIQGVGLIIEGWIEKRRGISTPGGKLSSKFWVQKTWTFVWVVLPASLLIDPWLSRGLAWSTFVPDWMSPTRGWVPALWIFVIDRQ